MTKKYAEPIPHFIPFTQNVAVTLVFGPLLWEPQQNDSCMLKRRGRSRKEERWMEKKISILDYGGKKK